MDAEAETNTPRASSSKQISPERSEPQPQPEPEPQTEPTVSVKPKSPSPRTGSSKLSSHGRPSMGRSTSSRERLLEEIAAAIEGRPPSSLRTSSSVVRDRFLAELGDVPGPPPRSRSPSTRFTHMPYHDADLGEIPGSSAASAASASGRPLPNRSASSPVPNVHGATGSSFRSGSGSGLSRDGLFAEIDRLHEILAREEYRDAASRSPSEPRGRGDREMTRLLRDMRADLAAERHRADSAEKRAREAMKHLAAHRDAELELERSRAQILESLKAYRDELKVAHEQLRIAQQEINRLAKEKGDAEEEAANARAAAHRATSTLEAERARDEGRRAGLEAAREEWERVLSAHEEAEGADQREDDDEDYVLPDIPSEAQSMQSAAPPARPRRTARGAQTPGPPPRLQPADLDVDESDDGGMRAHAEMLGARLRDAQRALAQAAPRPASAYPNTGPGREEELLEQMIRRTDARIKMLFKPGPLGLTSCLWHTRHRDPPPFAAGMAPQGVLNCGCSVEEGLFEESLMRNNVGSLAAGQANLEPELRKQLLELLKKRWDYQDGDFEIDRETGDWRTSEGPEHWERALR